MGWFFYAALSSVATASFVAFGGAATRYMPSATMNAIQASAMLATTLVVSGVVGSVSIPRLAAAVDGRGLPLAILAGVSSGVAWIAFFTAQTLASEAGGGSAARVAAINATYIVLLAIAAPLVGSDPAPTSGQWSGIVLVLAGSILVLSPR